MERFNVLIFCAVVLAAFIIAANERGSIAHAAFNWMPLVREIQAQLTRIEKNTEACRR